MHPDVNPRRAAVAACLWAAAWAATASAAPPCGPFADVDSLDGFCASIVWIYNRGVTVGCAADSAYCPDDAVTRRQMAAFMRRLGNALTLQRITSTGAVPPKVSTPPAQIVCEASVPAVQGYPRSAIVTASVSLAFTTASTVRLAPAVSSDGGATWQTPTGSVARLSAGPGDATRYGNATLVSMPLNLEVGTAYLFGVEMTYEEGAAAVATTADNGTCQVAVDIRTRDGFGPHADGPHSAAGR